MTKVRSVNMIHHTSSVQSQMMESGTQELLPHVGMKVTKNYYTDRHAATVTEVVSENTIKVRQNKVKTIDYYAEEYEIFDQLVGAEETFTKRKNGRWVIAGDSDKTGLGLSLGVHDHRIDPSF